jgi:hypothetical protein
MKLLNLFKKSNKSTEVVFHKELPKELPINFSKNEFIKSFKTLGWEFTFYGAEGPNEFIKSFKTLGWEFTFYGAEGPYFDKGKYRLQVIDKSSMPSVINKNYQIEGNQNLIIFTIDGFHNIFFGYAETKEELEHIFKLLKI